VVSRRFIAGAGRGGMNPRFLPLPIYLQFALQPIVGFEGSGTIGS
jgi:hypothetical protein